MRVALRSLPVAFLCGLVIASPARGQQPTVPDGRFLAIDVAAGVVPELPRSDEAAERRSGTKGWALDGTVRFMPWLGITGGLVRSSPSDRSATHYLVGLRANTPFSCASRSGVLDVVCARAFGHALVGAGVPRDPPSPEAKASEFVVGGGLDLFLIRVQFDYVKSSLSGADDVRALLGGVVPLCFRRCGQNDGFDLR